MLKALLAVVVVALVACGGAPSAGGGHGSTASPPLAIATLGFFNGDTAGARLHETGTLEIFASDGAWHTIGTLTPAGTLTSLQGKVSQLHDDGWFTGIDGQPAGFQLFDDSVRFLSGGEGGRPLEVRVDETGAFQPAQAHFRVTGATDAATKRTALFIYALMMTATF